MFIPPALSQSVTGGQQRSHSNRRPGSQHQVSPGAGEGLAYLSIVSSDLIGFVKSVPAGEIRFCRVKSRFGAVRHLVIRSFYRRKHLGFQKNALDFQVQKPQLTHRAE